MYAIVEIAGQQFKVEKGSKIFVHHLGEKEGAKVSFDKVLLTDDGKGKVSVGTPFVSGISVNGKVLEANVKGDKVIVFKKKRRKGYRVKNGHRQQFSQVEILDFGKGKATATVAKTTATATTKKEDVPVTEKKVVEKKTAAPKKATTTEKKTTATKSTATKKTTVAKTTTATKSTAAKKTTATKKVAPKKTTATKKAAPKKTDK